MNQGSDTCPWDADSNCFNQEMASRAEFLATLPRKRVTAGVVVRDIAGRVLLVEPTYRDSWLLPGGTVESHESPAQGAAREVLEELGVSLNVGRALVMQWMQPEDDPDGVLHFAYDGGVVDTSMIERFRLPSIELRSCRFFDASDVPTVASAETSARVSAALNALAHDTFIELKD